MDPTVYDWLAVLGREHSHHHSYHSSWRGDTGLWTVHRLTYIEYRPFNLTGCSPHSQVSSVVVLEKTLGRPKPVPVIPSTHIAQTRTDVPMLTNSDQYYV